MNILYLCHRFPYPPKRGGKIRPFNMIRHLSEGGHRVTVCSLVRSRQEGEEGQGLAPHCAHFEMGRVQNAVQTLRMVARLPTPTPSSMGYFYSPYIARAVENLLRRERFDLIFVHCSSVAQYVENVTGIPKILDFGDMDSHKWLEYARFKPWPLSWGYTLEGRKLMREEKRLAARFDLCTATTRAEWETLTGYGAARDTDWFPNGVNTDFFSPATEPYEPDTLSFIGRMDYFPNQEAMFRFCRDVWPQVRQRRPNARLLIVGADPTPAVRRLEQVSGVSVTGSVPDVRPYVRQSAAMVAPLSIARGTQNKILEAMAMGVPVVTSPQAAGGVDAEDGAHFLVAGRVDQYVEHVLTLMDNPAERQRLAEAGRARMLSHHNWDSSMRRLDAIIARCIKPPRAGG